MNEITVRIPAEAIEREVLRALVGERQYGEEGKILARACERAVADKRREIEAMVAGLIAEALTDEAFRATLRATLRAAWVAGVEAKAASLARSLRREDVAALLDPPQPTQPTQPTLPEIAP